MLLSQLFGSIEFEKGTEVSQHVIEEWNESAGRSSSLCTSFFPSRYEFSGEIIAKESLLGS